jgi:tight adherence protein B
VTVTALVAVAGSALVSAAGVARLGRRWRRGQRHRAVLGELASAVPATALTPGPRRRPVLRLGRRGATGCGLAVGTLGGLLVGGPVAALVLGAYAGVGAGFLARRGIRRAETTSYRGAVDAVAALAAEVRAGLPVGTALAAASSGLAGPGVLGVEAAVVARRVASAVAVAESSGAPLADVLDRLDLHLRAVDRVRATVSAQAAGAQVSALLLAAMPVAGVGLGYLLGVDPRPVLLGTRLGAACLFGAVVLQLSGLGWAGRLVRVVVSA